MTVRAAIGEAAAALAAAGVDSARVDAEELAAHAAGIDRGRLPIISDKASTFPTSATECTAYLPATRVEFVEGAVAAGVVENTASRAEFTATAAKTIYGAFLVSAQAKGAITGVLMSAARFTAPKVLQIDDVLRVTASFSLTSA